MKKYISIILLALFAVVGSAAQNVVSISSGQGVPGDIVTVDISLQNSDEVTAVEVVVPLVDKQLTYVNGSCVMDSERANGHRLSAAVVDGALKIYIYSMSLASFNGNEGRLASFSLKLGNTAAEIPLLPKVVLSDTNGKALPVSVVNGAVTILAPQIEVVTQSVDFGRVPIMSQYTKTLTLRNSGTLPLEVTGMEFCAAEFSAAENSFTIAAGATKSISIAYSPTKRGAIEESVTIISNAVNGMATATLIADPYSVNELHSSRAEGIAGEEVTVELRMNNMEPIVGLQTMFTLPVGVEYVDGSFTPTERAASHTAMASVSDRQLTLILYSSKNTPMEGNDGVVATFRLRLDCNSGSYKITPQNTVLGNVTVENMVSAVSGNYIVVKSPNISGNNELDFGKTPVTEIAKANYSIKNSGNATLVISSVSFLSTGYRVANELPLSIKPGTTGVLNVEFTPTTEGEYSTTMNIYSNDPDEKLKTVRLSGTVYEPNNLTFEGENLQNGDYVVSIGLENYTGIVAMQMDIHWMSGMTTSADKLKVSSRLARHSCSITKIDEDTYRFVAFSFGNNSIVGNEGKLFDLTFTPGNGVDYKDTPIVIDNVVLSSSEANNYTSQLTLNAKAEYFNYYVRFVCDGEVVSESFQRAGSSIVQPQMPERTGYTFAGWKGLPELSPAEDVVYTGEYNVNKYKLDYLVNGVVFATDSIAYSSEIVLREFPTKEGHTFGGWSEAPSTMPAQDVVVEGCFTANSYNVIYNVDGEEYETISFVYGTPVTLIEEPQKEGHTFSGWSKAPVTMPANDITIEGSFTVNYYTVTYIVDGEVCATETVAYGSEITLIEVPVKEGYTFSGWSNVPVAMPADDVVIEGSFSVNSYNIIYKVDGDEYKTVSVVYGTPVTLIEAPTKLGHTFSGWKGEQIETPGVYPIDIAGNADNMLYSNAYCTATLYGDEFKGWYVLFDGLTTTFFHSEYNVGVQSSDGLEHYIRVDLGVANEIEKFSFTYTNRQGERTGSPTKMVVEGSNVADGEYEEIAVLTDLPTYNSTYTSDILGNGNRYRFVRFRVTETYSNQSPSGHPFFYISEFGMTRYVEPASIPVVMPAEDVVIEGEFTVNNYAVTYMVDGEVWMTDSVAYGNDIVLRDEPIKSGHTFGGWSEAPATMPAQDIVIEGTFAVNTYSIIYKVAGAEYKVVPVAYGSEITLIEEPHKEGHTFSGWSKAPVTMPAEDIVIKGSFTVNYYTVTYLVNGEVYATETVAYGSEIVLRDESTKEGHTFSGWSEAPVTMPAEEIVIEGSFTVNYYTVTYLVDGEVYATETVAYGSEIVLRDEPTKEGHTFSSWSQAPETMPAEDITIEGFFTPITWINGVECDAEDLIIYNLRGERIIDVDELEQGFYIINGKKVWVK